MHHHDGRPYEAIESDDGPRCSFVDCPDPTNPVDVEGEAAQAAYERYKDDQAELADLRGDVSY